jgi:hypothetical protein
MQGFLPKQGWRDTVAATQHKIGEPQSLISGEKLLLELAAQRAVAP